MAAALNKENKNTNNNGNPYNRNNIGSTRNKTRDNGEGQVV
jgi:hypothetical protein